MPAASLARAAPLGRWLALRVAGRRGRRRWRAVRGLDPATVAEVVGHDDGGYLIATVYTKLGQRRALARAQRAMDAYQQRSDAATPHGRKGRRLAAMLPLRRPAKITPRKLRCKEDPVDPDYLAYFGQRSEQLLGGGFRLPWTCASRLGRLVRHG